MSTAAKNFERVLAAQKLIQTFFLKYRVPYTVKIDGKWGEKSREAARVAQLCLGWHPKYATGTRSQFFYECLKRPGSKRLLKPIQIARGLRYRHALRATPAQMPLRLRAFKIAESLVGVTETSPNSGPMVNKIIYSGGGWATGLEWCGLTVSYCYRNAGYKKTTWRWMRVWSYLSFSGVKRTSHPQKGDLVRFKFGHIGLFDKWISPTEFLTIEGNTSSYGAVSRSTGGDGVYRKRRHRSLVHDFLEVL